MKAYLITTGLIFALVALAHVARTIVERSRFAEDPWFLLEGPGLGPLAGGICFWACRLRWVWRRS
jgi:hypothetical protein